MPVSALAGFVEETLGAEVLADHYGATLTDDPGSSVFDAIAAVRAMVTKGGEADVSRAAAVVVADYRAGRLTRAPLDDVLHAPLADWL